MTKAQASSSSPGGREPTSCGEPNPATDDSQTKLTKEDARLFEFPVEHCEPSAITNLGPELKTLMELLNFLNSLKSEKKSDFLREGTK